EGSEQEQEESLLQRPEGARQEYRDEDDRPELPRDAAAEHGRPHRCGKHAPVYEDRDQHAQGGGAERDSEQPPPCVETGLLEEQADREADRATFRGCQQRRKRQAHVRASGGSMIERSTSITASSRWSNSRVRTVTMPQPGRDSDSRFSSTSVSARIVSPAKTGAVRRTSRPPRLTPR